MHAVKGGEITMKQFAAKMVLITALTLGLPFMASADDNLKERMKNCNTEECLQNHGGGNQQNFRPGVKQL